jgi:hypothetical protein
VGFKLKNQKIFILYLFSAIFFFIILNPAYGQEKEPRISGKKNFLSFSIAQTYVPKGVQQDNLNERGHFVPGLGLDYFRKILPKWEIGIMLDLELGEYLIPREKPLIRQNAIQMVAVGSFSPFPKFGIFTGPGVELEKHESFLIYRIGAEYIPHLGNEWFLPVGTFFDIKKGYDSWSLNVGIGKAF